MKTILFVVGPALGHVGRSLVIARAVLESTPNVRVVFAHIVPGHGDRLLRPEFYSIRIRYRTKGDQRFSDRLELTMRTVDPALTYLYLSPVPWLYLVRFPEIPRAYITNFFLTSLVPTETFQVRHLNNNFKEWNHRRLGRDLPELRDAKTLYDSDAVLLCDPVELVSSAVTMANPYHLFGPCVWQPRGSLPSPLRKKSRILLVSLGSTGSRRFPDEMAGKLRHTLDCDLSVWVTGRESARKSQKHGPIYSAVPLRPILQRSALGITQGGTGSTYAALLQGVPVAIWPSHRNHEILGELLTGAGVGAFVTELANLGPARAAEILLSMI